MKRLHLVALAVLVAGCTEAQAYVVTSAGLTTLGNEFADVADAMNKGLDAHRVSPEQYDAWRAFAIRFNVVYPGACDMFEEALAKSDRPKREQAAAVLATLALELRVYSESFVHQVNASDGGVP
jgi:hypothetical protein